MLLAFRLVVSLNDNILMILVITVESGNGKYIWFQETETIVSENNSVFRNLSALIQLFELFGHGQLLGQDGAAEESSFMCKDSIIEQKREAFKNKTISL